MFTETAEPESPPMTADQHAQTRRDREKAAVAERLLEAARALLAESGPEAVTLRAVADALGYTPPAIYAHFPDKQSLMRAIMADDFARLSRSFASLASVADPLERIERIGRAYIRHAADHPAAFELLMLTRHEHPADKGASQRDPSQNAYAFLRSTVAEAVEQGFALDANPDVDLLAQTLWAGVHGVAALAVTKCNDSSIDWRSIRARSETMINALMLGLFSRPAGRKAGGQ